MNIDTEKYNRAFDKWWEESGRSGLLCLDVPNMTYIRGAWMAALESDEDRFPLGEYLLSLNDARLLEYDGVTRNRMERAYFDGRNILTHWKRAYELMREAHEILQ